MILPNSLSVSPPLVPSSTSQLLSLPRIPYFFTITPYSLATVAAAALTIPSCHSLQQQQAPLSPPRMKRRYTSTSAGDNLYPPGDGLVSTPELPAHGPHVEVPQQQIFADYRLQDESSESGVDNIEGRVLKKMRRIKLNSDSPPADNLDGMPEQHDDRIVNQESLHTEQPQSRFLLAEQFRVFGPIKISTKSPRTSGYNAVPASKLSEVGQLPSEVPSIVPVSRGPALYSGMNNLLHEMHAARFGIPPDTTFSGDPTSTAAEIVQMQLQLQQQQQLQQQYPQHYSIPQESIFTANTAWHHVPQNTAPIVEAMDEDDEMAEVGESAEPGDAFGIYRHTAVQRPKPQMLANWYQNKALSSSAHSPHTPFPLQLIMSAEIEEKLESMEIQDDDLVFDLSMKKKKKKSKKTEEEPVEEAAAAAEFHEGAPATDAAEENPMAMFGEKKKKKKVKTEDDAAVAEGGEEAAAEAGESFDFGDMKKKKKKSKKVDFSAFEDGQEQEGDDGTRDPDDIFAADDDESATRSGSKNGGAESEEGWIGTNRDYTYTELLSRVFKILRQNNPELAGEKKRYTIVPPSVMRDGNKKTVFANVADICKRMHRQPEHVIQFLFAELGTSGSIDGSQRLVIKGRFQQKQIEAVLRRYIVEYVTCKTCKSPDTILTKENRLFFLQCEACGSTRSVSAIKSGFQAQTGKRAAQRVKAAAVSYSLQLLIFQLRLLLF
ncbi:hypothetical protein EDD11_004375 [Mortierella claussenii]|nr:hypothetical protein EDD11_004375 [Mortierella claussenii]